MNNRKQVKIGRYKKMRRENRNRSEKKADDSNHIIYISVSILVVAIVAFIASFIFYGNYADDNFEVGRSSYNNLNSIGNQLDERIELQTAEASSSMGKSVNEMVENDVEEENNKEEGTKIAVNTSAKENKKVQEEEQNTTSKNEETTKVEEKVENPTFEKPVEGTVVKEFAKDNLVYSNTLKEWTTHNGVDIEAEKTTVVKTAAEGKVKAIKNDPRYGLTVVVDHANGFQTIYANLLSTEFVVEGEELERGQAIGTVGNTATFEIADNAHLHFEILKDGEYLDPELYIEE